MRAEDEHAESEFEEMAAYDRALTSREIEELWRSKGIKPKQGLIRWWAKRKFRRNPSSKGPA